MVSKGETFTIASLKLEMDARSFSIEYSARPVSTGNSEVRNQVSDVQQAADKAYDTLQSARSSYEC